MAGSRGSWTWDVSGFEPPQPATTTTASAPIAMPRAPPTAMVLRPSAGAPRASPGAVPVADRLDQLADSVQLARDDCLELRQEASDLLEYSNAKLGRVTRYLGFLADRTRKLDQAALETEARITPLIHEKKRLFNDLLTLKGNVKVFCRSRPLFEDEGLSVVEFPDDLSIRVNTGDESLTNPKKDYEFDRVYGPHIGQGEVFLDVQPFVQSALDGYNVSIFAYGQSRSGKTHTLVHIKSLTPSCMPLFNLQLQMKSCANCLFNTILSSSYDKYYLEYHFIVQGCTVLKPQLESN